MSAFVKAAADALHLVPAVNAVIDGDEIVYRDFTDISIAVATPKGLVVPVLRNADLLGFAGVEKVPPDLISLYVAHPHWYHSTHLLSFEMVLQVLCLPMHIPNHASCATGRGALMDLHLPRMTHTHRHVQAGGSRLESAAAIT